MTQGQAEALLAKGYVKRSEFTQYVSLSCQDSTYLTR